MFQTTNQKNPHQFPHETSPSYGISMLYPHSQDLQLLRFLHQAVQSSFLHRCDVQRIIMCCWNVLLKWIVVILCYNMFVILLYDVPHWCFKATFGCHLAIMDRLFSYCTSCIFTRYMSCRFTNTLLVGCITCMHVWCTIFKHTKTIQHIFVLSQLDIWYLDHPPQAISHLTSITALLLLSASVFFTFKSKWSFTWLHNPNQPCCSRPLPTSSICLPTFTFTNQVN